MAKVTIGTITKERSRFFHHLTHTIMMQDFPLHDIQWIVVEDGDENVSEIIQQLEWAEYHRVPTPNTIGYKRNYVLDHAIGEYIIWFDDDNYAFPCRISSSIAALRDNPNYDIAGSSEMYILDNPLKKIYSCGPFFDNHATLGTWMHRKSLIETTRFEGSEMKGEEVTFTKDWSIPIFQLPKEHTNVSFDHGRNTMAKSHLLNDADKFWEIPQIIKDKKSRQFFESY